MHSQIRCQIGSHKGSWKLSCSVVVTEEGSWEGFLEEVLRRGVQEGTWEAETLLFGEYNPLLMHPKHRRPQKHYIHTTLFSKLFLVRLQLQLHNKFSTNNFSLCFSFPCCKRINYNYINDCLENYLYCQVTATTTWIISCGLFTSHFCRLSGPISLHTAILSVTIAAIPHIGWYFLREVSAPPKWYDTPPLATSLTHAHLCDIPSCNVPHKKKNHERVLRYYRCTYRSTVAQGAERKGRNVTQGFRGFGAP